MQITTSSSTQRILSLQRLTKLGLVLGILITVSACSTVVVDPVKSNHPANTAALSAPEAMMSDILNVEAVESTEAPVMDHSMHNM